MDRVLVTGGTGSFGKAFIGRLLRTAVARVVVYSRDELKQHEMRLAMPDERLRFFIGDVRDERRLTLALRGVDTVVHAAALKQVPVCEYNPTESLETNTLGAQAVIRACLGARSTVERAVFLSTDKACAPTTTYGACKLLGERLFVSANSYSAGRPTFTATRYGNVAGSRGSVIPIWRELAAQGKPLPVTHPEMTRFWMTLDESVDLVLLALREGRGGEVFIPKLSAYRLADLVEAFGAPMEALGVRGNEKMHEALISPDEARAARYYGDHYRILPVHHSWCDAAYNGGETLPDGWTYTSDRAARMNVEELRERVASDTVD